MLKQKTIQIAKKLLPYSFRYGLRILKLRVFYEFQRRNSKQKKVFCCITEEEFDCFVKLNHHLYTWKNEAKARHRMQWHFLKNQTNLLMPGKSILHIAPESCLLKKLSDLKDVFYYPADKLEDGYDYGSSIHYIDLLDPKLAPNSFDGIICNHVLEHIPDDRSAMKEMFRLLKDGGVALITVPIREDRHKTYEDFSITEPKERIKHFGQWDHVRYYGLDIKERLEEAGFETKLIRYYDSFSPEEFEYFGFEKTLLIEAKKLKTKT